MSKPILYELDGYWYYQVGDHILAVEKSQRLAIQNGRARAALKRTGKGAWPGEIVHMGLLKQFSAMMGKKRR